MKHSFLLFHLLLIVAACLPCMAQEYQYVPTPVQEKALRSQADSLAGSLPKEDYTTLAKFTYPKVVQMMGGQAKMIGVLKKGIDQMKSGGTNFKSVVIGPHSTMVRAGKELHTLMPQTIVLTVPNGTLTNQSWLLATSADNGKNWYFVDTSSLNADNLKTVFPNYNFALKIPPKKEPVFTPNK